jgi:Na+/H+ antiporter NhaC
MRKVPKVLVRLGISLAAMAVLTLLLSLARPDPGLAARMLGRGLLSDALTSLEEAGIRGTDDRPLTFVSNGDETCREELGRLASLGEGLVAADPRSGEADVAIRCWWEEDELHVTVESGAERRDAATRVPDYRSVVPPILAVMLALGLRNVQIALLAAIWSGALLFAGVDWTLGIRTLVVHYLWETLIDQFNFSILVFTLALVGMVQIANRAGGGQGLADAVGRMARSGRSSKLAASILGLLIFFDDYSNTVVVGTTIRTLTDRYRVSREKLAYIVDSTSAPVAGIALISTWIGYEVGLFQELSNSLGLGIAGYAIFLKVLPLRFYCFGALALVVITSAMNRDFGPMLRAERRAATTGELTEPGSKPLVSRLMTRVKPVEGVRPWWPTVVVPVLTALSVTVGGMIVEGGRAEAATAWAAENSTASLTYVRLCFEGADAAFVLLIGALAGSWAAGLMALTRPLAPETEAKRSRPTRMRELLLPIPAGLVTALVIAIIHEGTTLELPSGGSASFPSSAYAMALLARPDTIVVLAIFGALSAAATGILIYRLVSEHATGRFHGLSYTDTGGAWFQGLKSMSYAISILVMAWAIRRVCDDLGTSTYIVSTLGTVARPWLIPALTFVLGSLVAFSTGTSWGTMGILIPTLMPFAYHMGGMPTLILSMGAVLDGAIFGDHCSPISDTTVLSSIATGCDHIDHVKTQIPYALTAFVAALACGYLPLGLGVPMPVEHIAGAVLLLVAARFVGRRIAA